MIIHNDQLLAALSGSICANALVDLLPEADITCSLKDILCIQREILTHFVEGRHYGSNNLDIYLSRIDTLWTEVNQINEAKQQENK